jgi:hypothetical protein
MKNRQVLMVLIPLVVGSPLAVANPDALALTVDLGSAKQKGDRFSDHDTSAALTLGYKLSTNWSLNLSYTDFGKAQMTPGFLIADGVAYDFFRDLETKGIGLAAQYLTDPILYGWSFGGRLGLMHVDSKMTAVVPDFMDGLLSIEKDSGTTPTAGLLAAYRLTEQLNLMISADYMEPEVQTASNAAEDIKTTRFALGLKYQF